MTEDCLGRAMLAFRSREGVLCTAEDFAGGQGIAVAAYACSASGVFGRRIVGMDATHRFLGFRNVLPLLLGSEDRERAFLAPFFATFELWLADPGGRNGTRKELADSYEVEAWRWNNGEYEDPDAMFVAMCLFEHVDLVDDGEK
jgi:hypothetical protein